MAVIDYLELFHLNIHNIQMLTMIGLGFISNY